MADGWKILEELASTPNPPKPSPPNRKHSYGLILAAVLVIVLVVWVTLVPLERLFGLSGWNVLLGAGIAAAVAIAILWKVPQWQVGMGDDLEPGERFQRVNEARKTLAMIVGAMALLAGFYATVQNLKIAKTALAVARENQVTDRFNKAIEQLGAVDASGGKNVEVRLAGIYALERIANESEKDHWPAMEVLAAYVRRNAPRALPLARSAPATVAADAKPSTDIQAVLTVLGRRNPQWEYAHPVLDLHGTDLRRANLFQAHLIRADFSGADLSGANLIEANLIRSDLRGADLPGADLNGAQLTGADLSGARLDGAKLGGAYLIDARLALVNLTLAKLDVADLRRADLGGADLTKADLSETDLRGADLRNAKNLTQQQIDKAKGDSNTKLPDGRRMPEAWKGNAGR